jgi:hypothetical protein
MWAVSARIDDHIPGASLECREIGRAIANQTDSPGWEGEGGIAAMEYPNLMPAMKSRFDHGTTNKAGATEEEDFHG